MTEEFCIEIQEEIKKQLELWDHLSEKNFITNKNTKTRMNTVRKLLNQLLNDFEF